MKQWIYRTAAIAAAFLLAMQMPFVQAKEADADFNPYVQAVSTLVSRFEASFGKTEDPEKLKEQAEGLARGMQKLLEEYNIDNDTTSIAFETLDGSLSYYMNADKEYLAASLYKVPLALYYYDQINDGKMKISESLPYTADMYEEGSVIAANYAAGSQVPLKELLETVIVNSDNTAGHILFENMGGWQEFRKEVRKYAPEYSKSEEFVSMDNVISARYMNELMKHLAENSDDYEEMISDLLKAQPANYLNLELDESIPQKYGAYGVQVNASGFNQACARPYVLTIMSDDVAAERFIGDVSALIETYVSNLDKEGQIEVSEAS